MSNCNCMGTIYSADFDTVTQKYQVAIRAAFGGPDVPGGSDIADLTAEVVPTESVQQSVGRVTRAIQAYGTSRGFTIAANNIILTGLMKGL